MLEKLKLRLASLGMLAGRDDTSQDEVLALMVSDAADAVLAYCHRDFLPEGLEYLVRELVVRALQADGGGNVSSVKRGDTQITYTAAITKDSLTERDRHALNSYRRLRIG